MAVTTEQRETTNANSNDWFVSGEYGFQHMLEAVPA